MISLRWHRKTVTQRRNARAKWLPVPRFHDGGMVKGVPMEVVPLLRDGEVIDLYPEDAA